MAGPLSPFMCYEGRELSASKEILIPEGFSNVRTQLLRQLMQLNRMAECK